MYTLDTHATIQELKSSGFNEKQAEALVTVISHSDAQIATKEDLSSLGNDLNTLRDDLTSLRSDLTSLGNDLTSLRNDLTSLRNDFMSFKTNFDKSFSLLQWVMGIHAALTLVILARLFI